MAIDVTFLELILQNWSAEREKNLTNCLDDPKDRNIKNNHLGGRWAVWNDRESSPTKRWDLIYFLAGPVLLGNQTGDENFHDVLKKRLSAASA